MTVESNYTITIRTSLSTNEKENKNQNQSRLALWASYMELLRISKEGILIGSLRCLHHLWLVEVTNLVFVLRWRCGSMRRWTLFEVMGV